MFIFLFFFKVVQNDTKNKLQYLLVPPNINRKYWYKTN